MYLGNWLPLVGIIYLSSSKIIHNVDEYLQEAPIIDLTADGAETILYVRLCEWSSMNGTTTILNMTRYCYCQNSTSDDPNGDSCSMPGPTLLMHDDTEINVTVINELVGAGPILSPGNLHTNQFKDMDVTNLHVHGLHVSPEIDDILLKILPLTYSPNSQSYPYGIDYHYPGTFWYHAHHHGSTTWQVNMGLHGALLMDQDGDTTAMDYEENILMFEWFYVIPSTYCNPGYRNKTCPGSDSLTNINAVYSPRFETYILNSQRKTVGSNFAMCDIYCSFDYVQREASGYVYDVTTDLPVPNTILSKKDFDFLFFFVNGQLNPKISMTTGEFRRLRMINSLSNWYLQFQFPSQCEWYLIATDGVYIGGKYMNYPLSNPSHNNQYIISPGGRADFMVKCMTANIYEIITTNDTAQDPTNLANIPERVYPGKVLFRLEVSDGIIQNGTDELPTTTPKKVEGTYIQDLTDLNDTSPDFETECHCNYHDPESDECKIEFKFLPEDGIFFGAVNGKPFGILSAKYPHKRDSLMLIKQEKAYEFVIDNNADNFSVAHVYHQHINPFQVQTNIGKNGFIALETTWWDTLGNNPQQNESEFIRMRFWTRNYPGLIITHCHLLQHEDKGMMGFYVILNETEEIPNKCPNTLAPTTSPTAEPTVSPLNDSKGVVNEISFCYIVAFIVAMFVNVL